MPKDAQEFAALEERMLHLERRRSEIVRELARLESLRCTLLGGQARVRPNGAAPVEILPAEAASPGAKIVAFPIRS